MMVYLLLALQASELILRDSWIPQLCWQKRQVELILRDPRTPQLQTSQRRRPCLNMMLSDGHGMTGQTQ